jgi:hypothetical protein
VKYFFTQMLLAMCTLSAPAREVWRRNVEDVMGSATTVRSLAEAETVHVWRLVERKGQVARGELGRLSDSEEVQAVDEAMMMRIRYSLVGAGKILTAEQTAKLKALILAPTSYVMHVDDETGEQLVGSRLFSPLIRIRFSSGGAAVETWVSFSWAHMVVLGEEKVVGGSEINPMRQELLALLKSAMADDPVIAKLR